MSNFKRFMKENKIEKGNTTYAATKDLRDEEGKPLLWTIKAMSTREYEKLKDSCMNDVPLKGRKGMIIPKLDSSKFLPLLVSKCTVEPNLNDKELQDSYGVMSAEDLVVEMITNPAEFHEFAQFIQRYNGFDDDFESEVKEAKK